MYLKVPNSTVIEADGKESGYSTRANAAMDSAKDEDAHGSGKNWNGQGNLETDRTVIEKRQPKLNKRHAMHAEAMTLHKGSLRIFRKVDRKFQESE